MKFGKRPAELGCFHVPVQEMLFYQYLPIKLARPDSDNYHVHCEKRLECFGQLIGAICCDFIGTFGLDRYMDSYIYLTARHQYQTEGCLFNRPGWHADGFGTNDINYVWSNLNSTEFSNGPFSEISEDHNISMEQFELQALDPYTFPNGMLLRLDASVVHRVAPRQPVGMRAFLKVSFSKDRYNLLGNSVNHELDYKWEMKERSVERNHPVKC